MRYSQEKDEVSRPKLDIKDRKILSSLAFNCRMPLTQLSKKVAMSRDAVNYRIKNYERRGVVQGYRAAVNISKLGYQNYHLFIRLNNPSVEMEQKIAKKLAGCPFVRAVINFGGGYDLEVALVAKDVGELDEIITKITADCHGSVKSMEILTVLKSYIGRSLPSSFYVQKESPRKANNVNRKLDKKDIKILGLLSDNARISLSDIATKIRSSADAVSYRIKNMESAGIITGFVPVMNYVTLGYSLYSLLLNISSLDGEKEKKLTNFLTLDKNVLWAVKTIGKYNLLIYLLVKNVQELQETSSNLRSLFVGDINDYEMLVAYEEFKYIYFPKDLF